MSLDYSKIPISPPPPGIVPNFDDPVSFSTATIILAIVFLTISCVFFGGRIYSKIYIAHGPGYDDWACLVAWIFAAVYAFLVIELHPVLKHSWDIPVSIYTKKIVILSFITQVFSVCSLFLSKLSLFLLYRKLFSVKRYMRILINVGIVFAFATYMTVIPLGTYYCTPRKGQTWISPEIKCGKALPYTIASGATNIIVDLYLLCLPIPIVWRLNLSRKRKAGVLSVFMVGIIGVALGIFGLYYRILILQSDAYGNLSLAYAVLIVEINVAIIYSSMPSFSAIFKHRCGKSHFFSSMLTRLRLWGRSREFKSNSWGLQKTAKSNENTKGGMHRDGPGLPEVPSGEMSRIRTFIWRNNRSAGDSTVEQFTLDEEHPMKPNHRTCVNDRMELSNNQAASQDQNRRQGPGVLDTV